jgi:hypothetical protein
MPLSRIRTNSAITAGLAATKSSNAGAIAENQTGFPNRGRAYNSKAGPRQRGFSSFTTGKRLKAFNGA